MDHEITGDIKFYGRWHLATSISDDRIFLIRANEDGTVRDRPGEGGTTHEGQRCTLLLGPCEPKQGIRVNQTPILEINPEAWLFLTTKL